MCHLHRPLSSSPLFNNELHFIIFLLEFTMKAAEGAKQPLSADKKALFFTNNGPGLNNVSPSAHSFNHAKIQYLHKMLDSQIETVNTLFEKDNAFEQIQAKLKQLEVKLNSIKEGDHEFNFKSVPVHNHVQPLKDGKRVADLQRIPEASVPFESLSKYKREKMSVEKKLSGRKKSNKSGLKYGSGKKLNFDQLNGENDTFIAKNIREGSLQDFNGTYRNLGKTKSAVGLNFTNNRQRTSSLNGKSRNQVPSSSKKTLKTMTRQNSTKKPTLNQRCSLAKSEQPNKNKKPADSSAKRATTYNQMSNISSLKNIATAYYSSKKDLNSLQRQQSVVFKSKINNIIHEAETKKLQKKLNSEKTKNEQLQNKIKELKSYKTEFEKLKQIFERDQRLLKARPRH